MMAKSIPVIPFAWYERAQRRKQSACTPIWDVLDQVKDPEVPVLSIWDLGVLCDVQQLDDKYRVSITPTYSGCPAMETIRADIAAALDAAKIQPYEIVTRLSPAWTTDWLSPQGREQLQAYGIAPPQGGGCAHAQGLTPEAGIECPHCGSRQTRRISEFGSTACKALFQCQDCREPFDYFKHF